MQEQGKSLADITRSRDLAILKQLTGCAIPPDRPSGQGFNEAEIEAIYLYASMTRNAVNWTRNRDGKKVGYEYESIDAWCE